MNIFNNPNIHRLTRILRTETDSPVKKKAPEQAPTTSKSDSVNLSHESKFLAAIQKRLDETPEVRTERVAQLKSAIENGTYHVAAEDIAEKMLNSSDLE